ncbi:MAG: AEC family transporter [Sarcina ventriculi]|uniref:Auxin efflux carrier n=1 Tax=Sarcina ventriculi TaxID=1267 RepID=A0ABM9URL5_SARVE|nr:AEC family transporter [Sarcina ventriculi]MDO4401762.1 AEC family transporter [Clostridiaceae bacterium]MBU5323059.1 AEC family transporter [Sarcina ventriculi]MCI5635395.1 AEC family transporter [Sarcina ventriculi]MDD7373794.1 AEC family transporter [Sarcina ventriculi]MDY7061905.1 AEC family transporter [Sarcina ventriculi]
MFFTSIESVLTIVILIAVGYFLQKYKWFGPDFSKGISKLVVNVGLPCSIFTGILANLTVGSLGNLGIGLIFPFGTVIVSYIIAFILMKVFKIRPERRGIFLNGVANANTIFVGMPLNVALFGEASIPYYLVCYISNTISTWVIGIIIMSATDPHKEPGKKSFNWKKVLTPPLVGFIIGLIFLIFSIPVPDFINSALKYLGAFVTPLALIYIGIMLYNAGLKNMRLDRDSVLALVGRFVICPIIIIVLIMIGTGAFGIVMPSIEKNSFIVQSATPMLAVLPILADQYHGDVKYATNITTISTVLFIVVVPVLMLITQYIK